MEETTATEISDPFDKTQVQPTSGSFTNCSVGAGSPGMMAQFVGSGGQGQSVLGAPMMPENDPHFKLINKRALEGQMKLSQDIMQRQGGGGSICPCPPGVAVAPPCYYGRPATVASPSAFGPPPKEEKGFFSGVMDWFSGGSDARNEDAPAVSMISRSPGHLKTVQFVPMHQESIVEKSSIGTRISVMSCPNCSHPMSSHHPAPQSLRFVTVLPDGNESKNITDENTYGGLPPSPMVYNNHPQPTPACNIADSGNQPYCLKVLQSANSESKNITDNRTFGGLPPSPMVYDNQRFAESRNITDDRDFGGLPPTPMAYYLNHEGANESKNITDEREFGGLPPSPMVYQKYVQQ